MTTGLNHHDVVAGSIDGRDCRLCLMRHRDRVQQRTARCRRSRR